MVHKSQITQLNETLWEIPRSVRDDMRVPARFYASEAMVDDLLNDHSLEQLINVTTLPGIVQPAILMPDAHQGYGFPIGAVAATQHPDGIISPGGIGYDINCGVRLLISDMLYHDVKDQIEDLSKTLYKHVPSGLGKGGPTKLNKHNINEVLQSGAEWAINEGYGTNSDLESTESNGRLGDADPDQVSKKAKERGLPQLGTIGSGNHFMEMDRVGQIFDQQVAQQLNLHPDQIVFLIHSGSRGLGHQVATDSIKLMMQAMDAYGIQLPDRQLTCVPFNSTEGQSYYHAMCAAANFAWCNRQMITWEIRNALGQFFGKPPQIQVLYDVAHNIAKIEAYQVKGALQKLIVHRKGATRAFGPGNPAIASKFQQSGQPVFIPGSMGTASYVLTGTAKSSEVTFGSTCHGAGRKMSRRAAKKEVEATSLFTNLKQKHIFIQAGSKQGVTEEAPLAYKDVDEVVATVDKAGIAKKVAKLKPLAVVKG